MKLQCENLMLSDIEKGNNLMLTRLTPMATLVSAKSVFNLARYFWLPGLSEIRGS